MTRGQLPLWLGVAASLSAVIVGAVGVSAAIGDQRGPAVVERTPPVAPADETIPPPSVGPKEKAEPDWNPEPKGTPVPKETDPGTTDGDGPVETVAPPPPVNVDDDDDDDDGDDHDDDDDRDEGD